MIKLLDAPPCDAAHRCACSACCSNIDEGRGPRLSLKLDVGFWIVTVPFKPNSDEALTRLV